jgi:hypothetical protein
VTQFEVVLTESTGSTVLTPWVTNLSFRSVDPGGFGSVTFDLSRDIAADDFEARSEVLVYDGGTGEQVAGGWILNPGRNATAAGDVWQVAALGAGQAHLQERHVPYCIIDTRTDAWLPGQTTNARLTWSQGTEPGGEEGARPGWTFTIAPGALNNGYIGRLNYYDFEQFSDIRSPYRVEVGGYAFRHIAGNTNDLDNKVESLVATSNGSTNQTTISTNGFSLVAAVRRRGIGTNWSADGIGASSDAPVLDVTLRYRRITSAPAPGVGGDDDWMHVWDMRVSSLRLDRDREPITTAGTYDADPRSDYVLAHEAIIDCWARFCPQIDLVHADIDETSIFQHRDLVWPDGVTPYDVMGKLMELDPAFTWAVWERQSNGLYAAEWRQRDTDVRYEIPAVADFSQTSPDVQPLDLVHVIGTAPNGEYLAHTPAGVNETDPRSKTVKIDRQMERVDFDAAAAALATEEVEASQLDASTAQATVAERVYDHFTGRWIHPYLIRPGHLCRVSGVRARVDTLNPSENDLSAIFRIVSNDYSVDQGSSRLELNAYTIDESRALANLLNAA